MKQYLKENINILLAALLISLSYMVISYKACNTIHEEEYEPAVELEMRQPEVLPSEAKTQATQVAMDHATSNQLKRLSDSIFKLKKENAKLITRMAIMKQSVDIGETIIPYTNQEAITDCDSFEKEFVIENDIFKLSGIVNQDEVIMTSLHIEDALYTRDVVIKSGFLNLGRKTFTQIIHSNPVFKTDSAQIFKVNTTPSWWHRTGKPAVSFGLGVTATLLIINMLRP